MHFHAQRVAQNESVGNLADFLFFGPRVSPSRFFLTNLAAALLAGAWTKRPMLARARQACTDPARKLPRLVGHVLNHFPAPTDLDRLRRFLEFSLGRDDRLAEIPPVAVRIYWIDDRMQPQSEASARWTLPAITTSEQLADRLGVSVNRLEWWADAKGLNRKSPSIRLQHYRYRWLPKRTDRFRLVEAPKDDLRAIQRQLLREFLDRIPPHPAAHGFCRGRSIVTYAAPHVGKPFVVRFDLADFFPSVSAGRVHRIFRMAGYPLGVTRLLTGVCTTQTPEDVLATCPDREHRFEREPYLRRHLAQGAPTSPALANLAAYRLDARLTGLAEKLDAVYTRYADDLAFSGGDRLRRFAKRLQTLVAVIAAEEGFDVNFKKCRFMPASVRQELAGVLVNAKTNGRREDFDSLKAILTNCRRHGPASQNRENHADFRNHLLGRIAHWSRLRPERGRKLRAMFDRIEWPNRRAVEPEPT